MAVLLLLLLPATALAAHHQVTLQLHWQNQFEFAGYYAALEHGFYRDAGLDVTIREGGPGVVPLTQMLQGKADFCVGGSELLLARLRGQPVVAVAAIFQHSASTLLVRADSGIYTPQDLGGRVVEMGDLESDAEIFALLMNEGITADKFIHVPSSFTMDNIVGKKVEALSSYLSNQPYFLKKASIPYRLIRPLWYGIDFYGDSLFTTETYAARNPGIVDAFAQATLKGWAYALGHPDELIRTIASKYPPSLIPRTQEHLWFEYQEIKKLVMPTVIEIGHMNPGRFRHMADTFVQLGLAKPGYDLRNFVYQPQDTGLDLTTWQAQVALYGLPLIAILLLFALLCRSRIRRESNLRVKAEDHAQTMTFRLEQALSSLQAGYWEWDLERDELYIDARTAGFLKLGTAAVEMTSTDAENTPLSHAGPFFGHLRTALADNAASIVFTINVTDRPPRWLNVRGDIHRAREGHITRLAGTVTDGTVLQKCLRDLQTLSMTDSASGASNRRLFFRQAEQLFVHAQEQGTPVSVALIEIDQIQSLTEDGGLLALDSLLKDFSGVLEATVRASDVVARIGNEEFFVLFPDTDKAHARTVMETLRTSVDDATFHVGNDETRITFSAGVADCTELPATDFRPRALISLADRRLHTARASGRDRIIAD